MHRRLALATINRNAPSETFIRAHVSQLPAEVHFMTGGPLPETVSIGLDGDVSPLGRAGRPAGIEDVARYLSEQRIEAVLAEYGPVGVAMEPACALAGLPFAVHFFGYDAYRRDVMAECGHLYPRLFDRAAAILAISRPMREDLIARGASPDRTHFSPCGYDVSMFAPGSDAGSRPPLFLAVGRLVEKKGPVVTIRAFRKVFDQLGESRLVMAGAGPLESECRETAGLLRLDDSIQFLGAVSHRDVARWMTRARVFVQHSLTPASGDREGTPLSILEASGSALPVVSTRHAGIPDAIDDGVTGFLVEEGDADAMARHMLALATDDALATRMGRAGHGKVRAEFSLESCISRLWDILSLSCLNQKERA